MTVFASTSFYGDTHHSPAVSVTLPHLTDDPIEIAKAAIAALPPRIRP